MNSANYNNRSSPLNHYIDPYDYDYFENEDDENFTGVLTLATDDLNNVKSCGPQKIVKDVSVQTVPVIDDMYIPWLLDAERKTEEFYVQLSNLVNTLYHSESKALKTKSKSSPPSGISIIKNTHSEKNYRSLLNTKSSGCTDGRNKNLDEAAAIHLQGRIHSILQSAMALKRSIPKLDVENSDQIIEHELEIVKTKTLKETNILKLQRSKSLLRQEGQHVYKMKRDHTLPTVKESRFIEKRQIDEINKNLSRGAGKSDNKYSVPKLKNVAKSTASGTSGSACNTQSKQISPPEKLPTKDTGAIPKTRVERRVTSASTTIRNQKDKKTNNKPLWK